MKDELTGTVAVQTTGVESKSEMESVVLLLDDDPESVVPLRRRDALALDAEDELAVYAGLRVRVVGSQMWSTFVVDEIVPIPNLDADLDTPASDPFTG